MNTDKSFWARVAVGAADACWEWTGACTSSGYGNLSWKGRPAQAHRVAFFLSSGGISIQTGFREAGKAKRYKRFVLHRCDNRRCCNPSHLFLGSMSTNQKDAYAKNRKAQPKSAHVNAKLTPKQVREIRRIYNAGAATQETLAAKYGVSQRAVSLIVRNETYKDVI